MQLAIYHWFTPEFNKTKTIPLDFATCPFIIYESCVSGAKSQETRKFFSFNTLFVFMTGKEMLHDKNKEIDGMNKEFQRQIQILVEDHRKEVDVSILQ